MSNNTNRRDDLDQLNQMGQAAPGFQQSDQLHNQQSRAPGDATLGIDALQLLMSGTSFHNASTNQLVNLPAVIKLMNDETALRADEFSSALTFYEVPGLSCPAFMAVYIRDAKIYGIGVLLEHGTVFNEVDIQYDGPKQVTHINTLDQFINKTSDGIFSNMLTHIKTRYNSKINIVGGWLVGSMVVDKTKDLLLKPVRDLLVCKVLDAITEHVNITGMGYKHLINAGSLSVKNLQNYGQQVCSRIVLTPGVTNKQTINGPTYTDAICSLNLEKRPSSSTTLTHDIHNSATGYQLGQSTVFMDFAMTSLPNTSGFQSNNTPTTPKFLPIAVVTGNSRYNHDNSRGGDSLMGFFTGLVAVLPLLSRKQWQNVFDKSLSALKLDLGILGLANTPANNVAFQPVAYTTITTNANVDANAMPLSTMAEMFCFDNAAMFVDIPCGSHLEIITRPLWQANDSKRESELLGMLDAFFAGTATKNGETLGPKAFTLAWKALNAPIFDLGIMPYHIFNGTYTDNGGQESDIRSFDFLRLCQMANGNTQLLTKYFRMFYPSELDGNMRPEELTAFRYQLLKDLNPTIKITGRSIRFALNPNILMVYAALMAECNISFVFGDLNPSGAAANQMFHVNAPQYMNTTANLFKSNFGAQVNNSNNGGFYNSNVDPITLI